MDEGPTGDDLAARASRLRAVRDALIIIGSSDTDARARFAAAGIERFLQRPWRAEDLIWLLSERRQQWP